MVECLYNKKDIKMTVSEKRIKEILEDVFGQLTHNEQVEILVEITQLRRKQKIEKSICGAKNLLISEFQIQLEENKYEMEKSKQDTPEYWAFKNEAKAYAKAIENITEMVGVFLHRIAEKDKQND